MFCAPRSPTWQIHFKIFLTSSNLFRYLEAGERKWEIWVSLNLNIRYPWLSKNLVSIEFKMGEKRIFHESLNFTGNSLATVTLPHLNKRVPTLEALANPRRLARREFLPFRKGKPCHPRGAGKNVSSQLRHRKFRFNLRVCLVRRKDDAGLRIIGSAVCLWLARNCWLMVINKKKKTI